jgi:hypothetical protein
MHVYTQMENLNLMETSFDEVKENIIDLDRPEIEIPNQSEDIVFFMDPLDQELMDDYMLHFNSNDMALFSSYMKDYAIVLSVVFMKFEIKNKSKKGTRRRNCINVSKSIKKLTI